MINDFILNVSAGGVFSKFMFIIQNIQAINSDFNSVYINNLDSRSLTGSENIFDNILEQNNSNINITYNCKHLGNYSKFKPIENSENLNDYKKVVKKLKFKKELKEKIDYYINKLNINNSFIGLHIRLCDMNIAHAKDYGVLSFNDYLFELKKHIQSDSKIFVASDNNESIEKLKKEFGDKIIYIPDFIRGLNETENTVKLQLNNFKNIRFWEEAFIEMFLLSKCGTLICRTSNVNNVSIIYSDTIKKIIRL